MLRNAIEELPSLYEADETAWLDAMVSLIRERRFNELDYPHLGEYLADMAIRDRREVKSRLTVLLAHFLKWNYQPDKRTAEWWNTVVDQGQALEDLLESGSLRRHAEEVLPKAYAKAVVRAAAETKLPDKAFPVECPYTIDQLITEDLTAS